jgi:hypothetical protein
MRHIRVDICFWNCAATAVEDVVAWARVLQAHGIILLAPYTLEPLTENQWEEIFRKQREEEEYFKSSISHRIAFEDWGKLNADFGFDEYWEHRGGGNKLQLGGLLDFQFKDERHRVEPFAQRLLAIARELYPLARPTYGEVEGDWGEWDTRAVSRLRLKHISWVNFFSPAYVAKYGRDFLLGLPGSRTELLPDGGVFHQLSPTFVAPGEEEARRLRQEVKAYCARYGLKVTCKAPFVIPGLTRRAEPQQVVTDAEVQEYLRHALATTLVLDDGTRVKPIYIPWEELTPGQRQMALEAIRQAAIAEIRRPGRQRIRFEFNAIPDELEQMLADLAGRDNPDFEWAEVAMGEGR